MVVFGGRGEGYGWLIYSESAFCDRARHTNAQLMRRAQIRSLDALDWLHRYLRISIVSIRWYLYAVLSRQAGIRLRLVLDSFACRNEVSLFRNSLENEWFKGLNFRAKFPVELLRNENRNEFPVRVSSVSIFSEIFDDTSNNIEKYFNDTPVLTKYRPRSLANFARWTNTRKVSNFPRYIVGKNIFKGEKNRFTFHGCWRTGHCVHTARNSKIVELFAGISSPHPPWWRMNVPSLAHEIKSRRSREEEPEEFYAEEVVE